MGSGISTLSELWTQAYQWLQRKQPVIRIKLSGIDHHYFGFKANPKALNTFVTIILLHFLKI
ncbi:hypothetical protein BpHYR1_017992 [Brachionus plicatilis]|uniref:Uncharacterized protein n=1 Tax=Brachionus plicatilis TaxID=10195 RepID=A0A3M7QH58_BRAPC|nr:hypothetical protein BpHYR1_017992 [Brachionus plicatilis]